MTVFKKLVICLIIFANPVIAQDLIPEQFNFSFDYAKFKGHEDYIYLESYFSIFRNNLQYIEFGDKFKAEFSIEVNFYIEDSLVLSRTWGNVNYVDSLKEIEGFQKLFSVNHFQLKPANYKLTALVKDLISGYSQEKETSISLSAFDDVNLCISDIEFASTIKPGEEKNQYYKNGYQVIPNTDRFYGTGLPMLMFYSEIYNLKGPDESDKNYYDVTYSILNSNEELVRKFPSRSKIKPGNSAVEVGGLNIITFTSGTYFLQIDVEDTTNNQSISKIGKFFVYRPGDFAKIQKEDSLAQTQIRQKAFKLIEGVYQSMTEKEIDNEFGAASYIATKNEQSIYKTLDLNGKRQFMPEFWAKRDKTPNTPRNEDRDDYLARMKTAEQEFRGFKKGWKSDEGRILLVYGVPDEIERFPSSNENKAYRIWRYFSIQGGIEFIFVDRRGWGEYELVHSNARGELFDQEWQRWIDPHR